MLLDWMKEIAFIYIHLNVFKHKSIIMSMVQVELSFSTGAVVAPETKEQMLC